MANSKRIKLKLKWGGQGFVFADTTGHDIPIGSIVVVSKLFDNPKDGKPYYSVTYKGMVRLMTDNDITEYPIPDKMKELIFYSGKEKVK